MEAPNNGHDFRTSMNCNTACPGIRSDMDLCSITTSSRRTCGRISRGRILITELVERNRHKFCTDYSFSFSNYCIFFDYRTGFSSKNNPKNLDPVDKMDLDLEGLKQSLQI